MILKTRLLRFINIISICFLTTCIEPYEFIIHDNNPGLVVEAYLSDKSFNETLAYPSDGQYQSVKLSYTSDVTNSRPELLSGADVSLSISTNEKIQFKEDEPGIYHIPDQNFKAIPGLKYKLLISLSDGEAFESTWEELPPSKPISDITFQESERLVYKFEAEEQVARLVKGIVPQVTIPENPSHDPIYYQWDFDFMWVYISPEISVSSPNKKCWITSPNYLNEYFLRDDFSGGYSQSLFFMETVRNDRIYNDFTALIRQHVLSKDYYYFLKEMKDQNQGGLLQDKPPFNLMTNITSVSSDSKVSGYFAVLSENAVRWYFKKEELSYFVEDTSKADCNIPFLDQAPQCTNCLLYEYGNATNIKPSWWKK